MPIRVTVPEEVRDAIGAAWLKTYARLADPAVQREALALWIKTDDARRRDGNGLSLGLVSEQNYRLKVTLRTLLEDMGIKDLKPIEKANPDECRPPFP